MKRISVRLFAPLPFILRGRRVFLALAKCLCKLGFRLSIRVCKRSRALVFFYVPLSPYFAQLRPLSFETNEIITLQLSVALSSRNFRRA